jgi:hypothetical protein
MVLLREIKENHIELMRSKKRVEKIYNLQIDPSYEKVKNYQKPKTLKNHFYSK